MVPRKRHPLYTGRGTGTLAGGLDPGRRDWDTNRRTGPWWKDWDTGRRTGTLVGGPDTIGEPVESLDLNVRTWSLGKIV